METRDAVDSLLAALDAESRDQLFPLIDAAPVVEQLTGQAARRSALHRWSYKGVAGVRLQTVTVGRVQHTTRRWLIEWFAAVAEARRKRMQRRPTGRAPRIRTTRCGAGRAQRE